MLVVRVSDRLLANHECLGREFDRSLIRSGTKFFHEAADILGQQDVTNINFRVVAAPTFPATALLCNELKHHRDPLTLSPPDCKLVIFCEQQNKRGARPRADTSAAP